MNFNPILSPGLNHSIRVRIDSDSFRGFYPHESEWIRSKFSIRMNQNQSGNVLIFNLNESVAGLIRKLIDFQSEWISGRIDTDSFGLDIRLDKINFQAFFNKGDSKRFSDWFGLIHIGTDTDIGKIRNSSDWFGMNSYPNYSESFRYLHLANANKSEPIRKTFRISFVGKHAWKLIRFNPNESEVNFQSELIRIIPETDWLSIRINLCSDSFGLNIRFSPGESFGLKFIPNHSEIWCRYKFRNDLENFGLKFIPNQFEIWCGYKFRNDLGKFRIGSEWISIRNFCQG